MEFEIDDDEPLSPKKGEGLSTRAKPLIPEVRVAATSSSSSSSSSRSASSRSASNGKTRSRQPPRRAQFIPWNKILLGFVNLFCAYTMYCWMFPAKVLLPNSLVTTGDTASVTIGNQKWTFLATEPLEEEFVFFDLFSEANFFPFGLVSFVGMSQNDYDDFTRLQAAGTCPADYLNTHTWFFFAVGRDRTIQKRFGTLKRGDRIAVSGSYLTYEHEFVKPRNVNFSLHPAQGGRSKLIYLETVTKL